MKPELKRDYLALPMDLKDRPANLAAHGLRIATSDIGLRFLTEAAEQATMRDMYLRAAELLAVAATQNL